MKRFAKYFSVLAVAASFCACQEKEADWYVKSEDKILEVTKADVTFSPEQSTGSIVLNTAESLTATSSESWCTVSVSGNTVSVSVEAYAGLEGRNATVEIKSATKSVTVPVHQEGQLLVIGGEKAYMVPTAGGSVTIPVKANVAMSASTDVDWMTVEAVDNGYKVTVAANEGAAYRKGALVLGSSKVWFGQTGSAGLSPVGTYTAYFQEYDEDDVLQTYYMEGVKIAAASAANTFTITGLFVFDKDYPATLKYTASSGDYYIDNAFKLGTYQTYTLRCMADYYTSATAANYTTTTSTTASATSAYRMSFGFGVNGNGDLAFAYKKNSNMNANYVTPGFSVYAYTSSTSVSSTYKAGWFGMYWGLTLVAEAE